MKYLLLIICTISLGSVLFGQSTWYEIPTGTSKTLNAIDFPSVNVGYIVGVDSTMLKTTDGGQTWNPIVFNGIQLSDFSNDFIGVQFYDVHFVDENVGFVLIMASSAMIHTVDGGLNWTVINPLASSHSSVYAWSSTDYLVGGGFGFIPAIEKTVSGVTTPSTIPSSPGNDLGWVNEISFANSNLGLAAMQNQYFLRTTDAGSTWDTIPTSLPSTSFLTSVVMVDDQLCYAGYLDGGGGLGILKSLDGGLTWQYDVSLGLFAPFGFYPNSSFVCASQSGDIYSGALDSVSNQPMIYETEDGITWPGTSVIHAMRDMVSCGLDITFGVGDSGYLVVNTPIADLGISQIDALEFDVYPNPVQNELTIENSSAETLEVLVLDASGRILKTDSFPTGSARIDCSNLKIGMYFIQVKVNDRVGMKQFVKSH